MNRHARAMTPALETLRNLARYKTHGGYTRAAIAGLYSQIAEE